MTHHFAVSVGEAAIFAVACLTLAFLIHKL